VLLSTFLSFCAFYGPQPLLPTFASTFDVTPTTTAWLLTLPFVCLAIGPVLIGSMLQHASAERVLSVALLLLALSLLGFSLAEKFHTLLAFRAAQAVMFPIIFTAAVTYCSRAGAAQSRRKRVAMYVSATILGGFGGRLFSGFVGEALGWHAPFILLSGLCFTSALLVWFLVTDIPLNSEPLRAKAVMQFVRRTDIRAGLAFVFTTFFTFSGALNVIPFRLVELQPDIPSSSISLVYLGYSVGIFIPLLIGGVVKRAGGEVPTLMIALCVLLAGLSGLFIPSVKLLTFVFLVISMGMFSIHATSTGLLNDLSPDNASVVNGAYISNYYAAAAIGSLIPVWLLNQFGWNTYVVLQLLLALTAVRYLPALRNAKQVD